MATSDCLPKQQLAALLTSWAAGLTTPTICLFKNDFTPTENNAWGDFVEPVGSWYTRVAAVYGRVFELPSGGVEIQTQSVQFDYTGTDALEVIYGWMVANVIPSPPVLYSSGRLAMPANMGNTLDSCRVESGLQLPPIAFQP